MAKRIFVGSLPYTVEGGQLETLFAQYGQVDSVQVIMDRSTGQPKGFAFVEMPNEKEAQQAILKLNGTEMGGRALIVNEAKERNSASSEGRRDHGGRF